MKKLISVILVLILMLIPLSASAEVQEKDPTLIKMGDVSNDGKITAMDARLILRYSAKLDTTELDPLSADADGNGKITASDARTVLRVAVGMTKFTCGFDGNGVPCAINTLMSDSYSVKARYDETGTGKGVKSDIMLSVNKDNTYLIFDTKTGIGMLLIGEQLYATMLKDGYNFAIPITDALLDAMGNEGMGDSDFILDAEAMEQVTGMITAFITDDLGKAERVNYGGDEAYCYSYTMNNDKLYLYVDLMGRLMSICTESNGKMLSLIDFTELSGDSPEDCFDLSNYEIFDLF